jgi:hypothetical protein
MSSDRLENGIGNVSIEYLRKFINEKDLQLGIPLDQKDYYINFIKNQDGQIIDFEGLGISKGGYLDNVLRDSDSYRVLSATDKINRGISNITTPYLNASSELALDRDDDNIPDNNLNNNTKVAIGNGILETTSKLNGLTSDDLVMPNGQEHDYGQIFDLPDDLTVEVYNDAVNVFSNAALSNNLLNDLKYYVTWQYGLDHCEERFLNLCTGTRQNTALAIYIEFTEEEMYTNLSYGPTLAQLDDMYRVLDSVDENGVPDPASPMRLLDDYAQWRFNFEMSKSLSESHISDINIYLNAMNEYCKYVEDGAVAADLFYIEWQKARIHASSDAYDEIDALYYNAYFVKMKIASYQNSIYGIKVKTQAKFDSNLNKKVSERLFDAEIALAHAQTTVSPLVLDVDDNGFSTNSKQDGVYFDLDNNGFAEKTAWTSGDAFLTYDLNGNGKIDNGGELFGNHTLVGEEKAADGFAA